MCENDAVLIENAEVNISQYDAGSLCVTSKLMTAFNGTGGSRAFTTVVELSSESIAVRERGKSLRRVHH